ncbi:hypothetical protein DN752_04700 [Echinicola strongylocentroti]|uniref:Uncharacterized protein n=1 Tax=Echinicola strongylocentroti TaxID=1795355 RepID=A0A2Z4IG73_9BACT|nr:hypothetical protein [Echinicola strongylocentroti]AWW29488.1 hypothetical protein DN752_04700 [Echinicola strongylocentroti]
MYTLKNSKPVPGWKGGFLKKHPQCAYPDPDLSALPMLDNLANINLLQRQMPVKWPEFSWKTVLGGEESTRCFQMFAPYISRLGYTDTGRVYSIICPQQGVWIFDKVCLNVEVTVTGQRGWVDESPESPAKGPLLAGDMTVEGKIWFSPKQGIFGQLMWAILEKSHHPFPLDKAHAIKVQTHCPSKPNQPIFPLRAGESTTFKSPEFSRHSEMAWAVGHLDVEIGEITKTNDPKVDEFNELVMKAFNIASGNMLAPGNILSWNVWFEAPELVNQHEWRTHAERWRKSIDEHHGSPDGPGSKARYFNGEEFDPVENALDEAIEEVFDFLKKHFEELIEFLKKWFGKDYKNA